MQAEKKHWGRGDWLYRRSGGMNSSRNKQAVGWQRDVEARRCRIQKPFIPQLESGRNKYGGLYRYYVTKWHVKAELLREHMRVGRVGRFC